jgi:hypothetical protein
MPRRIPKWVWEKAKAPLTIKAFFLFFMVSFFAYTVVRDDQKAEAFNEETRSYARESKEVHHAIDLANERADKQNQILDNMGKSLAIIEETLRTNRDRQREEHALLAERRELPKPRRKAGTRKKVQRNCYKLVNVDTRIGNTIVRRKLYVRQQCK